MNRILVESKLHVKVVSRTGQHMMLQIFSTNIWCLMALWKTDTIL